MLISFEGKRPQVGKNVFVAPTAVIIGDVHIGDGANIWFGAVIRGDLGTIQIGPGCSIQDNVTIHVPIGKKTIIGSDVTVGHGAVLEGCNIGDRSVIGMRAVVLEDARIGTEVMLAAGSVVVERAVVPARSLAAGAPAQVKKPLSGGASDWIKIAAQTYHELRDRYISQGIDRL